MRKGILEAGKCFYLFFHGLWVSPQEGVVQTGKMD
jgi:hypothetical protein